MDYKPKANSRQELIFKWLKTSKYSNPFEDKDKGFYVEIGSIVRLKSGERIDLLNWLILEGFNGIREVGNFTVYHKQPFIWKEREIGKECLCFHKSPSPKEKYDAMIKKRKEFEESCKPDPNFSEGDSIVDNWLRKNHAYDGYDDYDDFDNSDAHDYQEFVRDHLD